METNNPINVRSIKLISLVLILLSMCTIMLNFILWYLEYRRSHAFLLCADMVWTILWIEVTTTYYIYRRHIYWGHWNLCRIAFRAGTVEYG